MKTIKVWFDGGAYPTNPGNGYGSYEVQSNGPNGLSHRSIRQQFGSPLTNNQAEYLALIAALKWLSHNAVLAQYSRLHIFTDSKLVAGQVSGRWKIKVLHIRELVDEVMELLDIFDSFQIQWQGRENNVRRFGH